MNDREYNAYIENYLNNDKTKSAIMLTAPWGMGKSFYIQNCLIPYLEMATDKKCIVVSLYGLNDIKEISKAIYLEMRAKFAYNSNEKVEAGKIFGKTILKGVLSKVGIDLSLDEADLEKLYSSIDLTNKLVILEDLERSGISIKQVLGFVNNLVEQDGVKVLLVANENEIKITKKNTTKDRKGNDIVEWVYTEETEEYLKIKEKTVSDTILYMCDYDAAIESILVLYSKTKLALLLDNKTASGKLAIASDIRKVMADVGEYNLRSFIFACQKTADIFSNYDDEINVDFLKHVFLGNVAFSLRLKDNDDLKWKDNASPNQLGTSKYPLYDFCKEYIKYQSINTYDIKNSQEAFIERKEFEKKHRETNMALTFLYDFTKQKEEMLSCAVEMVRDELKVGNTIPLVEYGKLANYLIAVKKLLEKPDVVDECKKIMIHNIEIDSQKDKKVLDRLRFHDSFSLWEDEQLEEYNSFIQEMTVAFQDNALSHLTDEEPVGYLEKVSKFMCDRESDARQNKKLMSDIDLHKVVSGLEKATAEQVSNFRQGILSIYGIANIRDFLPNDKEPLIVLREKVQELLDENKGVDKVVRLQYSWLRDNLEKVIDNY